MSFTARNKFVQASAGVQAKRYNVRRAPSRRGGVESGTTTLLASAAIGVERLVVTLKTGNNQNL